MDGNHPMEDIMATMTRATAMTLSTYLAGGYATCHARKSEAGRLYYTSHDSGARTRWMQVIRAINAGDAHPSYVTSAGDYLPVRISHEEEE